MKAGTHILMKDQTHLSCPRGTLLQYKQSQILKKKKRYVRDSPKMSVSKKKSPHLLSHVLFSITSTKLLYPHISLEIVGSPKL